MARRSTAAQYGGEFGGEFAGYGLLADDARDLAAGAVAIQAGIRGRQSRNEQRVRSAWLEDVAKKGNLTPRDLGDLGGGRRSIPEPLKGARPREALIAERHARAAEAKELKGGKGSARGRKSVLPEAVSRPSARPSLSSTSRSSGSRKSLEPEWRRANKEFILKSIIGPLIDKAAKGGEAMLAARKRQTEYEARPLQKPVCVASLFGTGVLSGDAHSTVAVVEQDGIVLLSSRSELMQLSLHQAPLPQLGLAPLVKQTEQQAAELPSTARLHSVTVRAQQPPSPARPRSPTHCPQASAKGHPAPKIYSTPRTCV